MGTQTPRYLGTAVILYVASPFLWAWLSIALKLNGRFSYGVCDPTSFGLYIFPQNSPGFWAIVIVFGLVLLRMKEKKRLILAEAEGA